MDRYPRRRFIGFAGLVGVASIAGCLGQRPTRVSTDEFTPPPGFTADGVDPTTALAPSSAMGQLASVTLHHEWAIQFVDFGLTADESGSFDFEVDRFRRSAKRFDSLEATLTIEEEYFDSDELFRRGRVEPRSLEPRHTAMSYHLDPTDEIGIDAIQSLLKDTELELTSAERIDGDLVGRYTASGDAFGGTSLVQEWTDAFGAVSAVSLEVAVTESGHLTQAAFDGTFTNAAGNTIELSAVWDYSAIDATSVEPPDWLGDLPGLERPVVELDIDEQPAAAIEIAVTTMVHTDEVAVVIEAEGVIGSVTAPGTIEVPGEAVTDADGRVQPLLVFAQNELRGPVQIEQYWPTPGVWESTD